jgi:hypothetical protein
MDSAGEGLQRALIDSACSGEPGVSLIAAYFGQPLPQKPRCCTFFPKGMTPNVPGLS